MHVLSEAKLSARRIYDYLVWHTDWDVALDSDDADDIIAAPIKSHTQ